MSGEHLLLTTYDEDALEHFYQTVLVPKSSKFFPYTSFRHIVSEFFSGIDAAQDYFDECLEIPVEICGMEGSHPSHLVRNDGNHRILLPFSFLLRISMAITEKSGNFGEDEFLRGIDISVATYSDKKINLPFLDYIFSAGIHETVHHLQALQSPNVSTRIHPSYVLGLSYLSGLERFLVDYEVEARVKTNLVLESFGKTKVDFEEELQKKYPFRYGMSFFELAFFNGFSL